MNQWLFVMAAYAVTAVGVIAVSVMSWRAMRRGEADAARLTDRA